MATSLIYLVWTLILATLQIGAAAVAKRRQEPPMWGAGARDEAPPRYTGVAGRLERAQANLFETLPIFIGGVLACHAAGRDGTLSAWGAGLYFWSRLVYVPIYAAGVPLVRTAVWIVGMVGVLLVLVESLAGG